MSAQESNQRKRLGDVLTAKSFVIAKVNQHLRPDFEPPSPRPPPGPPSRMRLRSVFQSVPEYVLFVLLSDFGNFDYCHSFDLRRKGYIGRALQSAAN